MLSYATMIVMTKRSVFLTAFSVFFDERKKRGDADHVGLHIWDLLYALLDSCVLVMLLRSRPSVDFPFFYMPIHQLSAHTSLHTLFHTLFCFLFDFFNTITMMEMIIMPVFHLLTLSFRFSSYTSTYFNLLFLTAWKFIRATGPFVSWRCCFLFHHALIMFTDTDLYPRGPSSSIHYPQQRP